VSALYEEMWAHVKERYEVNPAETDPILQRALRFLCGRIETMEGEIVRSTAASLDKAIQEERRFQAAKAAMTGLLSDPAVINPRPGLDCHQTYAAVAVEYADALLAALAKPKEPT